jgi:hypothetical protein
MENKKQELFIVRRIGGTTYKVKVAFSETEKETMEDKILRMIRNEVVTNDGTCDIMDIPQKKLLVSLLQMANSQYLLGQWLFHENF